MIALERGGTVKVRVIFLAPGQTVFSFCNVEEQGRPHHS